MVQIYSKKYIMRLCWYCMRICLINIYFNILNTTPVFSSLSRQIPPLYMSFIFFIILMYFINDRHLFIFCKKVYRPIIVIGTDNKHTQKILYKWSVLFNFTENSNSLLYFFDAKRKFNCCVTFIFYFEPSNFFLIYIEIVS